MTVTSRELREHFFQVDELVGTLERAWAEQLPTLRKPDSSQWLRWLRIHDYDIEPILHGIKCAATKLRHQPDAFHDADHPIAYVSKCANRFRPQRAGVRCAA